MPSTEKAMRYLVAGRNVVCGHCENEEFTSRPGLINTRGLSFFGFDFANREATILVCSRCGHLEWFLERPLSRPSV